MKNYKKVIEARRINRQSDEGIRKKRGIKSAEEVSKKKEKECVLPLNKKEKPMSLKVKNFLSCINKKNRRNLQK